MYRKYNLNPRLSELSKNQIVTKGVYGGEGGNKDEADRPMGTLALASVGGDTQEVYWNQWKT